LGASPTTLPPKLGGGRGFLLDLDNFAGSYLADQDGGSDHIGGSLLTFGAFRHVLYVDAPLA
jgi:hypothetical protein